MVATTQALEVFFVSFLILFILEKITTSVDYSINFHGRGIRRFWVCHFFLEQHLIFLIAVVFFRPCPFLARKKMVAVSLGDSSEVDSNLFSSNLRADAQKSQDILSAKRDTALIQDREHCQMQSGIRIGADGKYEVYIDGKLFEDKAKKPAPAASQNVDPKVLQSLHLFKSAYLRNKTLFFRRERLGQSQMRCGSVSAAHAEATDD